MARRLKGLIYVRCTPQEAEQARALATKAGLSVNVLMRLLVRRAQVGGCIDDLIGFDSEEVHSDE